jgi:4-amino-4-deoxychorismate lyase
MLVNGFPSESISIEDRGFFCGDGVSRTSLVHRGAPHSWQRHYLKLRTADILLSKLQTLCTATQLDSVAKIIVTRGVGPRGYAPPAGAKVTRIQSATHAPFYAHEFFSFGIALHIYRLKLGHQPLLAGIKHLNRLENVFAASECQEVSVPEWLLEDED